MNFLVIPQQSVASVDQTEFLRSRGEIEYHKKIKPLHNLAYKGLGESTVDEVHSVESSSPRYEQSVLLLMPYLHMYNSFSSDNNSMKELELKFS